jgi:hypothetical protein
VNGQLGWSSTGPYDQGIVANGITGKSLRLSNAVTSGNYGDQTYSAPTPGLAGESRGDHTFSASFDVKSKTGAQQPGLAIRVSPTDKDGSRMSYVRLEDQANGTHVLFYEYANGTFKDRDIATLSYTAAHNIQFKLLMKAGATYDQVKVWVDGKLTVNNAASWEDYYRFDPEQAGNGNKLFGIDRLVLVANSTPAPGTAGNGYLFDNVALNTSA